MNQHTSPALDLARAYFDAWTGHDMDKAMTYIAADIVCDTPAGRIRGADAFRHSSNRSPIPSPVCVRWPPSVTRRPR